MTKFAAVAAMLLALAALLSSACGGNPNEHVEANELFRPAAAGAAEQSGTAADAQSQQQAADAQAQAEQQAQQGQQAGQQQSASQQQSDSQAQASDDDADQQQAAAPPPRADDLLRRYINPSYGYSLELICPPFCDPSSNGIDRAAFLAESGRALLDVTIVAAVPDDQLDAAWREALNVPDFVDAPERQSVILPLVGVEGWRYVWEEDRRATGGFLVRWEATLTSIDGLLYVVRGGAVEDDYEATLPALEQAFDSFIAPLESQAMPGEYQRFDFSFVYGTSYVAQEFGVPSSNPPNFDAGIVVLQSEQALDAVLVWEVVGAAFFNADVAIERTLADTLGAQTSSNFRDTAPVDGQAARMALSETAMGEGLVQIASYSWYCSVGGREFSLHVIDSDDPEAAAVPLLAGFSCESEG